MRTLLEIIDAVKSNQGATEEEMFYAIVAMDALNTFDSMSLRKLANEPNRFRTPQSEWEESFNRWKRALNKSPKEYVGWENDPKNPDVQKRRATAFKIVDKVMAGVKAKEGRS